MAPEGDLTPTGSHIPGQGIWGGPERGLLHCYTQPTDWLSSKKPIVNIDMQTDEKKQRCASLCIQTQTSQPHRTNFRKIWEIKKTQRYSYTPVVSKISSINCCFGHLWAAQAVNTILTYSTTLKKGELISNQLPLYTSCRHGVSISRHLESFFWAIMVPQNQLMLECFCQVKTSVKQHSTCTMQHKENSYFPLFYLFIKKSD